MNFLKIETFAGASGDMFLGALCALADAYDELLRLPALLHLENEAEIIISDVNKTGIACKHVKVVDKVNRPKPEKGHHHHHPHDHDHGHHHSGEDHSHEHTHVHHEHSHSHHHRHLSDIYRIIDNAHLNERTKEIAREIFRLLGEAEAQVHGVPIEKIHFHEVGAIDSIIDIIGVAWLLDRLDLTRVYCTPVTTGFGFARTEHGKLPIPCPATQRLLLGFPTQSGDQRGELTTPTGAAILKFLQPDFVIPALIEEKTGYGPGEKDLEIPNTLRLSLCRAVNKKTTVSVIQVNLDDMPGEFLGGAFQESLRETGALDYYLQQVIMKKGRPGVVLTVLCREEDRPALSNLLLNRTSTIGLRYFTADRIELERKEKELDLPYGTVRIKEVTLPDQTHRMKPESDDLFRLSRQTGRSVQQILADLTELWQKERRG